MKAPQEHDDNAKPSYHIKKNFFLIEMILWPFSNLGRQAFVLQEILRESAREVSCSTQMPQTQ